MRTVTVRRSGWVRGVYNGDNRLSVSESTTLLNCDGNKCCLGFAICQISRHIPTAHLLNRGDPFRVFERASFLTEIADDGSVHNNKFANRAIEINDSPTISERMREARLKRLFRANGIKLKFVD